MMKAQGVYLRPEITREDAYSMLQWVANPEVSRYLHEDSFAASAVRQALERVQSPTVTHLFNQNGALFVICTDSHLPIGFLRLARHAQHTEMVLALGEVRQWGKGLGTLAIRLGLHHAFFQWRTGKVIARIHPENIRSIRAFEKAGFAPEASHPSSRLFSIGQSAFLQTILPSK